MQTFSGLSKKDRRTNRIFGSIFILFLSISILRAVFTPQENELSTFVGTLEKFECVVKEHSRGSSQWLEISVAQNNELKTFVHQQRCKTKVFPFEKGAHVVVRHGVKWPNDEMYSLEIDNSVVVQYKESARQQITAPFTALFVFGLPWAIWLLAKVVRS